MCCLTNPIAGGVVGKPSVNSAKHHQRISNLSEYTNSYIRKRIRYSLIDTVARIRPEAR